MLGAVRYREIAPEARLSSLVAGFWAFPVTGHAHRILPDGCMDIVVLNGRASVVGTMKQAIVVPPSKSAVLGIRMRPGEAARLFPVRPYELTDGDAPLAELWGDEGRKLEDALLRLLDEAVRAGFDAEEMVRRARPLMEDALQKRLASHGEPADLPIRAGAHLLGEGAAVHEVATRIGMSERQLARRFVERVGVSPRVFGRVRRLQRAALEMQRGARPAEVAAAVGYADQPHFTRDATALTGATPGELARELCDGLDTSVPVAL
jgi:AraC-like DNA-binding protein